MDSQQGPDLGHDCGLVLTPSLGEVTTIKDFLLQLWKQALDEVVTVNTHGRYHVTHPKFVFHFWAHFGLVFEVYKYDILLLD